MSGSPIDSPKAPDDPPKERADAFRFVAGAALLVLSVPCLGLGLPGIVLAIGLLVHATLGRASVRGAAILLGVIAVSTWWPLAWCLVDARLDPLFASLATFGVAAVAAALAPLVLAPLVHVASTHTSETRASDTHTSETRASETRTSDTHTPDTHTSETRTSETRTSDTHTSETRASDTRASDTHTSDTPAPSSLADLLAHPASRGIAARVAVLLVALAALAPPIWLSPLLGYLLGASGLALGLAFGLPRALRARRADVSSSSRPARTGEGLTLALAWTLAALSSLAALQFPAPASPGALGADTRAFDRPRREGSVLVSPHELGFVVAVADGGGVGLVRTPFGRPARVSIDVLEASPRFPERTIRICAARDEASSCVVVDDDGVRRDDGPLERARAAYGTIGLALLAVVASLLLALAIFGAHRPHLARVLAFASAVAFTALASIPWWQRMS